MKSILYVSAMALFLLGCNSSEVAQKESKNSKDAEDLATVIKPMSFDPGATVYKVSANSSDTIFTPTGSTIIFQANSFVDADGNPVKGTVDVQWQEFHTLGDIVASGIPMKYDSAGVEGDLESGGMFTIDAMQNGKNVEIAPGKTAKVNLTSLQDTPCYNFYKLDEKTGDWDYETTKSGKRLDEEDVAEEKKKPLPTILDMQLNTSKFPELASKDIIGWKCAENLSDNEKTWLKQRTTKVALGEKSGDSYVLLAKDDKGAKSYRVTPYERSEAVSDSKINRRELEIQSDEVIEYAKNMAEGNVVREIEISGFGTYNWDIMNKRENSLPLFAKFEYPGGVNKSLVTLRLISPDENVVVMYNAEGDAKFSFDPGKRNLLIGILPNNEIVAASDADFNAARSKKGGSVHTFTLKRTGRKIKAPSDIMKYMNELI